MNLELEVYNSNKDVCERVMSTFECNMRIDFVSLVDVFFFFFLPCEQYPKGLNPEFHIG